MRKWYKYSISRSSDDLPEAQIDSSFIEHSKTAGDYEADIAYEDKESFFNYHFYNYQTERLVNYSRFIVKHLNQDQTILSVASGRCATELYLSDNGYSITCSDLEILPSYEDTIKLFPDYRFITLNILEQSTDIKYDAIIVLSLIYVFDDEQLDIFFRNINRSLKKGGSLVLDSAGSPDNFLSYIVHDVICRFERYLKSILLFIISFGNKNSVYKKHHGYRRNDSEIDQIAQSNGFELIDVENYAFLTEFSRSRILRYLMVIPFSKSLFSLIGKKIPYIRMFKYRKNAD